MKVKVTQCSLREGWYKDHIGETFEVVEEETFGWLRYRTVNVPLKHGITGYYIEIEDAEEIQ